MTPALTALAAELRRCLLLGPATVAVPADSACPVWRVGDDLVADGGGAPSGTGRAFGRAWPFWYDDGRLVTPGVPVVVGPDETVAAGGSYRLDGGRVLRESVARESILLATATGGGDGEDAFDALWFDETERCRVAAGRLSVEDLFVRTELPLVPETVAGCIDPRRRDTAVAAVEPLCAAVAAEPATIMVARPAVLLPVPLPEPAAVLAVRADVAAVHAAGDELVLRRHHGDEVRLEVTATAAGWRAIRVAGQDLFEWLELARDGERITLTAAPGDGLDLRRRALRSRLGFDLGALLIAVGGRREGATQNE